MIHNGHFFTLLNLWHLRNPWKFLPFTMVIGLTLFEGKCCISFFLLFELLQLIFCIFQLLEESGLRAWRSCNIAFDMCVCRPFETTDMTCLYSSASDESQKTVNVSKTARTGLMYRGLEMLSNDACTCFTFTLAPLYFFLAFFQLLNHDSKCIHIKLHVVQSSQGLLHLPRKPTNIVLSCLFYSFGTCAMLMICTVWPSIAWTPRPCSSGISASTPPTPLQPREWS